MFPYKKEKIENAICYFATMHAKKTKRLLTQTSLYKYLALLEFESIQETGKPAFELTYRAMKRGPVPLEIYNKRFDYKTDLFEFIPREVEKIDVKAKGTPGLEYFSEFEIKKMEEFIFIYAQPYYQTKHISVGSHEIKAWRKAWTEKPNSIIDYADQFDDLDRKSEDELTLEEESYLIYKGLEKLSK